MRMLSECLAAALRSLADEIERPVIDGTCVEVAGDEQGGANPSPAFATEQEWPRETFAPDGLSMASPTAPSSMRAMLSPLVADDQCHCRASRAAVS